jgi:hypothetical protein
MNLREVYCKDIVIHWDSTSLYGLFSNLTGETDQKVQQLVRRMGRSDRFVMRFVYKQSDKELMKLQKTSKKG